MNKDRREAIAKAVETLEEINSDLETIADEEQEYFDNMPENLQGSERGQQAEQAADQLTEAKGSVEDAIHSLQLAGDI